MAMTTFKPFFSKPRQQESRTANVTPGLVLNSFCWGLFLLLDPRADAQLGSSSIESTQGKVFLFLSVRFPYGALSPAAFQGDLPVPLA